MQNILKPNKTTLGILCTFLGIVIGSFVDILNIRQNSKNQHDDHIKQIILSTTTEEAKKKIDLYLKMTTIEDCKDYLSIFKFQGTIIVGRVDDSNYNPVSQAVVEVYHEEKNWSKKTFANGNFVIYLDNVSTESLRVRISHPEYHEQKFVIGVEEDIINVLSLAPLKPT